MASGIFDVIFSFGAGLAVVLVVLLKTSIKFVPQNRAYVIERFGKYRATLTAGLNFIVPFVERVAYDRTLKEQAADVPSQSAITKDNIGLTVDGVLYMKVLDPYKASYGVEDYIFAVTQLAQTTMRSEIGKRELIHSTALGKAILAQLPSDEVKQFVASYDFKPVTPRTITDPAVFLEELAETKARGFSVDNQENELGGRCVAAPILNYLGKPVAALSLSVPIQRFPEEKVPEFGEMVRQAARKISMKLGASFPGEKP